MKTSDSISTPGMSALAKGPIGPAEPHADQSRMIIDLEEQPPCVTEPPQQQPLLQPQNRPKNQLQEFALAGISLALASAPAAEGHEDHQPVDNQSVDVELIDEYFDNDSSSEGDPQQAGMTWVDAPGTVEVVGQSSDEYGEEGDDIGDEEDDDDDNDDDDIEDDDEDDILSEDTGDTDEPPETTGKGYTYSRAVHHGPYLKPQQHVEQLRKGRLGALRKKPLKLRTISRPGTRSTPGSNQSANYATAHGAATEEASAQQLFASTCDEITRALHQGPIQQGINIIKDLIESTIEWRSKGELPTRCQHSVEQLRILENGFFATWAKVLVERRPNTYSVPIAMYLKDFVHLGILMVQQDEALPELYGQVLNAMLEHGDLEIYKRNSKRPSRLAHSERMGHFEDYVAEYGPEEEDVSQMQQEFQRLFFTLGGVEACIKAIESHVENIEYPDARLRQLQLMLSLMSRIPVAGDSEQSALFKLADYSKRLVSAILKYFPDNADSFRSLNKAAILEIISQVGYFLIENYRLQSLHPSVAPEKDADYEDFDLNDPISRLNLGEVKFADFRLEMAVRLMKTSRLDLRLAGLIELKEVLARIQRLQHGRTRMRRRSEADMDMQMDLDRKPVEHLCSKLQSMHIVGCIFGSNIHLEIVQRSTDVLVFLVQARVLASDDIDLIWTAVGGNQHPSVVYGVYQVLGELSSKLPHEFLRNIFTKLQAVPLENWDLQLVDLARSLFQAMVQRSKYSPEEGPISLIPYETLLNVLRNSTPPLHTRDEASFGASPPSNRDVITGIALLLKEGLGVGPLPQDRTKLIEYCTQDLQMNHPGAIWSLQVVQNIFESQPISSNESAGITLYKQACSSLLDLYMSNLTAYTSSVKALPPTPSPTLSSFAPLSTHYLSQEYWRSLQLKIRLEFLRSMARNFPIYWNSPKLAETLWNSLIVNPIGTQEQDETFVCLEAITEPVFAEYIYEKLLPGLEISSITQKAWQCVRQYFLLLNWHRRNVIVSADPAIEGSQAVIVLAPLYGMDLIWRIALHARLPIVGAFATDLLSLVIKTYAGQQESAVPEKVYEFREGLVETCIEHLVESSDQLGNDDEMGRQDVSLVFERCIGILKAFLVACNAERSEGTARPEIHGTLDEDAMLTIKVNSNLPMFQVSVHPSGTLSSLRKIISLKLGCSEPEEVRLFSMGKDFAPGWESRTLEELHVENGQSFLASKRPLFAIPARTAPIVKRVPTDLLLKPGFFERIRQIFLLDENYASQAWEVVMRLPTSPVLQESLEDLQDDVDWASLLDARSPFLLLYSLQIVSSLIKRDQCFEDPMKQSWIKRFLELGGQQFLTTLLMSESGLGSTNSSPTARKALALMLRVLVRLTHSAEIESDIARGTDGLTIPVFLNKLVQEILTSASRQGGHSSNDQGIVLNATSLISYLCAGPLGWNHFHAGPDIRSLIFVSMVQTDSIQIRQTVLEMGRKFCLQTRDDESTDVSPVMFFLDILQSFLPIAKEYEGNCSELFEFFELISREAIHYCSDDYYKSLYMRLLETIVSHQASEDMSMLREDTILIGMLKVATAMINADPSLRKLDADFKIIDYVFDECLFPQTSDEKSVVSVAKCQSEGSRAAAFQFVEEQARGEPETLRHIIMKTRKHFERESELEDQWGYDPQMIKKASCGFVGLQNLGATCYVNSLIQQFFMNKEFRYGILKAPVEEDDPGKHDTLLYQLQALFGNLQESIKRAYNAHGFCYSYKDWDGNPMNVAVQMDVDEFFSILFDRLENSVKGTPQEELFKYQYGGKLVQQIKSKDCEHISEREDSFFSIQCEVKNKKTLEESLQLYVQGEILDGDNKYKCSSCDKHVDAIKRACIKELPQNLVLHLKRFDYDMDTMRRIKINDRFEFPTRLDMEPYTLDYLSRKEQAQEGAGSSPSMFQGSQENAAACQYNLVGVLVHTGTADSGHYYSYIKDRSLDASLESTVTSPLEDRSRWYLFNDSKVEQFDPSEIPAKAFGGIEFLPQDSSPYLKSPPRSAAKPYSAYMLFYERADHRATERQGTATMEVPEDIQDVVATNNRALMKDLAVFDRLYYRFVWDLLNLFRAFPPAVGSGDGDGNQDTESLEYLSMQYGLDFFFAVLIHARDVDQELQQWTRFLSSLLAIYPKGCANFLRHLTENQTLMSNVLLYCPITQVREAVIDLIYEALHGLREKDKVEYGLVPWMTPASQTSTADTDEEDGWVCEQGSPIHGFIRALLRLLPEARANWRNFDEYLKLIYNVTQLGRAEKILMAREGYISALIDFYISDEKHDTKKKKMGDKFTKPSFRYLLLAVQEVLATCDISLSYEALGRRSRAQEATHSQVDKKTYRKSMSSTSSTSSVLSSSNSDEAAVEDDIIIPSVSPELDQAVLLSHADFNALFACYGSQSAGEKTLILIPKMIQDRVDSSVIARMIAHLSSHETIGHRLLESLGASLQYANEDQFSTIMQVFKDLVQVVLERSPQPSIAYDCLDYFRTISDYGQCGRFAQAWLLRNDRIWLQELLLNQGEADTRLRARLFFMELVSSERAFNGWTDEEAAIASGQHFERLLELMKIIPEILAYYPAHVRRDDDEGGWKFVEYFKVLTELVKSDSERTVFGPHWPLFLDILSRLDSQQLNLDYDKKEMMVFWSKIMTDDKGHDVALAKYKTVGVILRRFYVCLQNNPANVQFHREVLPIYFGFVLRFCKADPTFHLEWAQCHNYTWAIGAMKWGAFTQHCPEELTQLLQLTLSQLPLFRQECWRMLPASETPRFSTTFMQLASTTFEAENALAGALFYQYRGLEHLTEAIGADHLGTATNEQEFFAVEALTLLHGYLCQMTVCRNTPVFAEAIDHWSNIHKAIELLTGNLMWTAPANVYSMSIQILDVIAKEATYTQAAPILSILDKAHCELRYSLDDDGMNQAQVQTMFGGTNSPYCQYGALESRQALSNVESPPMRIGPLIFMHPELFKALGEEEARDVLERWFQPYWQLARSACKLDGGREHFQKSIELAALLAMEQAPVGSLIHLEILCETALEAGQGDDIRLSLQSPFVTLFVERFLKRENYIGSLKEAHLRGCATLVKCCNLDQALIATLSKESHVQLEQILSMQGPMAEEESMALEDDDTKLEDKPSAGDQAPLPDTDSQLLVTTLQNIVILTSDVQDSENKIVDGLKKLPEWIQIALPRVSEGYREALLAVLPRPTPLTPMAEAPHVTGDTVSGVGAATDVPNSNGTKIVTDTDLVGTAAANGTGVEGSKEGEAPLEVEEDEAMIVQDSSVSGNGIAES
ncbi:hypothetical protein BGZ99_006614 [Dissophora globulifera]|uniref:Ubiquitinyl hydrolase 1 n=1 Tax=Dissophora globulifera TaxID=979702 RepID=A0A9P6RD14_9FUNG|nr:hypothetical protein BGZ99_006614 [Dissophora globulifera]